MHVKNSSYILILFVAWTFLPCEVLSQLNDAGLWMGFKSKVELTKKLDVSVDPEIRLSENLSYVSGIFTDVGAEYRISKPLYVSVTYRIGARHKDVFWDMRQRISTGLEVKQKFGDFSVSFLTRYQASRQGIQVENDPDFSASWRNKLSAKFDGIKKTDLGMSFELFQAAGPYETAELTDWRWTADIERKLSKRRYVSLGYLIQKNLVSTQPEMDFVVLAGYKYLPDFSKKKKKKKKDPTEAPK